MVVLPTKLRLFDVQDTEAFCADLIRRTHPDLQYHDNEDLLAYLIETAWEYSIIYQPSTPPRFAIDLRGLLRRRLVDWQRQRYGRTKWQFRNRTYERPRPTFVQLDDQQDSPHHSIQMDTEPDSLQAVLGLDGTRDRPPPRHHRPASQPPARRAA